MSLNHQVSVETLVNCLTCIKHVLSNSQRHLPLRWIIKTKLNSKLESDDMAVLLMCGCEGKWLENYLNVKTGYQQKFMRVDCYLKPCESKPVCIFLECRVLWGVPDPEYQSILRHSRHVPPPGPTFGLASLQTVPIILSMLYCLWFMTGQWMYRHWFACQPKLAGNLLYSHATPAETSTRDLVSVDILLQRWKHLVIEKICDFWCENYWKYRI